MTKRIDPKPIDPALLPASSLPIGEALQQLHTAHALTAEERDTLGGLVGVRTYGDLLVALGRGDLPAGTDAERLRVALGVDT